MDVDLFIKRMPRVIKDLISREAANNRRSVNQEAIALLEEALLQRVGSPDHRRRSAGAILERLAAAHAAPDAQAGLPPDTESGGLTTTSPGALDTLPHKLAH